MADKASIQKLLDVMARLRDPVNGCPWDIEQDFKTIAPYTIEETYELVEAIEQGDLRSIAEELGDVLFQVVFHAQLGKEAGLFDFESVAGAVADKMIERHPHVFSDREANSSKEVLQNWETDKAKKRAEKAKASGNDNLSVLDGVATTLPAMTRATKLQGRAARVGFDWKNPRDVIAKIQEELHEVEAELDKPDNHVRQEEEIGDLLFVIANLARKLKIDPETALRRANRKFEQRFGYIEKSVTGAGHTLQDTSLEDMETLWLEAKTKEKAM